MAPTLISEAKPSNPSADLQHSALFPSHELFDQGLVCCELGVDGLQDQLQALLGPGRPRDSWGAALHQDGQALLSDEAADFPNLGEVLLWNVVVARIWHVVLAVGRKTLGDANAGAIELA
eukprot:CAMPEP_0177363928 /NCGR_PEP_ID=MMETSP0368-20130122/38516_1 /TAXON_ID=447022 ORGANISM="Scrippsiella hangoei-like, Strain SHHI-4" /NCGR_SAMPLE_ID=MMETSP0368 /ASSEMBLY_ACC=CAM_ASM_000363 /LENGTH=119 /DNA_ID=CAMNT_0018826751 /DNA_START=48 /DNA_END=404 /DNA_ORIENTATION=+